MDRTKKARVSKVTKSESDSQGLGTRAASPPLDQAPYLPGLGRAIFEGSLLPIATLEGPHHILRYANSAFCRLAGRSKDELTGKFFAEIMPGDGYLPFLDRVYHTGTAETKTEQVPLETHSVYWSCAMWPIFSGDNHPVGVVFQVNEAAGFQQQATAMNRELLLSVVRQHELIEKAEALAAQLQSEMEQRKVMEQGLIDSEKLAATGRLASTMSHEINNPLAAITNLVYLLGPLQTSPEAQDYVATLESQVKGLSRIATQMLKFNRDNNQPTHIKLEEVIHEIADFYRPQADKLGVAINQRIEAEGAILGFRGEIVQVFTNLLLNAMEATPAGGQVTVHLYPSSPWLCTTHSRCGFSLSVADTGRGVDPQLRARVFEPFFTTKGDKGTGLGLWLCRGIVSRVGGSIRLWSSRLPGRSGSCFSVFLPAEEAQLTPRRRRYERPNAPGRNPA
jgi:signal transduction histidine kinase